METPNRLFHSWLQDQQKDQQTRVEVSNMKDEELNQTNQWGKKNNLEETLCKWKNKRTIIYILIDKEKMMTKHKQ